MKQISPFKKQMVKDLRARLESSPAFFLVSYKGLTVAAFSDLRRKLDAVKSEAHVVPNALMEIAALEAGLIQSRDQLKLAKDTTLITGGCDPIQVAKIVKEFAKKNEQVVVKVGQFDGKLMDAKEVQALADIPPRETLYAMLLGVLQAAPQSLVCVLAAKAKELEGGAAADAV